MHTVAVTAGSQRLGRGTYPPELDAAHTFYILRVRDGEERKQGGGHKQGYLHNMVN